MARRRDLWANIKLTAWLTAGGFLMTPITCTSCLHDVMRYLVVSSFCAAVWIAMWFGNDAIVHWLDDKVAWTKEPVKRFVFGVVAMLVYTIGAVYILMIVFRLFGFYLGSVTGTLYFSIIATSIITFLLTARSFLFNWRQAAIDAEKLQKEGMAAKYESLKNQLDPHFLFNSLNALTNLVYDDQDKAAKFIKQLSEVYRYVLDTREKEVVPISAEVSFLKAYLFLQQIRFGAKLRADVSLNGMKGSVPPLVLQMLIENAIKHNIISEEMPLTIRVFQEGNSVVVENVLQEKSVPTNDSQGIGLDNIRRRYKFLTNDAVEIIRNDKFIVKLPLLPNHESTDH